jgi:hypothetical protein
VAYFQSVATNGGFFHHHTVRGRGGMKSQSFIVGGTEKGAGGEKMLYLLKCGDGIPGRECRGYFYAQSREYIRIREDAA